MASLLLEDLLKDELAEDQVIPAWERAAISLFLRLDPIELSRVLLAEIGAMCPKAISNLRAILDQALEYGVLGKLDPDGETERFFSGLSTLSEGIRSAIHRLPYPSPDASDLYLGLQEELDEEVFTLMSRQDRLVRILNAYAETMEGDGRDRLKSAISEMGRGFASIGLERTDAVRNARSDAQTLMAMPFGEESSPAVILGALANWKLTRSLDEPLRILRRGWPKIAAEKDLLTYLAGRILGHLEVAEDDLSDGWNALVAASEAEDDSETCLELALLAIRLGKWDQARSAFERGLAHGGPFLIRALAHGEMIEIAGDVIELIVQRQKELRKVIGMELELLASERHRIQTAEKKAQVDLGIEQNLSALRKAVAGKVTLSDSFKASGLIANLRRARQEGASHAQQQIGFLYSQATQALAAAKTDMDQAWSDRESRIASATKFQQGEVNFAREALRTSLRESDKSQTGCVVGFGSGCGAFVLYLIVAAFLAGQGVNSGFGSIFGWFGIAASGIPIGASILAQVGYGLQRATLDRALHEKIKLAQAAYENAAKAADDFYRETVLQIREGLGDLEAKVLRLEDALKSLNAVG
jgi:hypothetical protein